MDLSHGEKQWRCAQCPAAFGRLDHLKRHVATHNEERKHVCQFCTASFGRGDVLRRHWKSCKTRIEGNYDVPETQKGGKHKRACDSCASIRKACNGEDPCSECNQRGRTCSYRRLHERLPSPPPSISITPTMKSGPSEESYESPSSSMGTDSESPFPGWELGPHNFYSGNIIADVKRVPQISLQQTTDPDTASNGGLNLDQLAEQPIWTLGSQNFYPQVDIAKRVWASRERYYQG